MVQKYRKRVKPFSNNSFFDNFAINYSCPNLGFQYSPMKKIVLVLASILMTLISTFAENVEIGQAQRVAESLLKSETGQTPNIHLIASADQNPFENFYVFGDDHCFVIVSSDDLVTPILGYSIENGFCLSDMPENIFSWLQAYDEEVSTAMTQNMEATEEIRLEWESLQNGHGMIPKTRASVSPLLKTTWGQKAPFNNLCPETSGNSTGHAYAGCVAVAMAQIMNYWEHPVRGSGAHFYDSPEFGQLSANFGATSYDWDNMKNTYSFDYSSTEADAVATLVYHCGIAVDMNYGASISSAFSADVPDALKTYFSYASTTIYRYKSSYSNSQWISMLKTELNNARPVYYSGRSNDVGHAFVCDGYNNSNYFHFNWGWNGHCNGYYVMGALNPGPGGVGSGTQGQFNLQNAAIFGCAPITPSINPPTNVNSSVNGRNVTITWNAANGAASYKLYRDNNLIANNLTDTDYTDTNVPYGNREYYLKSVSYSGIVSLKSANTIADVHFAGPVPTNLQASLSNSNVHLTWNAPASETTTLQYGTGNSIGGVGFSEKDNYWAQRFPASTLSQFAGMAINKVSVYFRETGNYILYFYKGDETGTWELMLQKNYTCSGLGWKDITISSPVFVDYTKDLWVVMFAPSSISYPAAFCSYTNSGVTDATYISTSGDDWTKYGDNDVSWLIKTYLTDGTYTYRVYRNDNMLASSVNGTTYTDSILQSGTYNYYITTNYYGGESDASNSIHIEYIQNFNITVSANPNEGGNVSGDGTYHDGDNCTVSAIANLGYDFVNWTENGIQVSTNPTYTFNVNANRNLVANFQLHNYTITASSNPTDGGSTSGSGTYYYGNSCTLTASANTGYNFINWTENGIPVSSNPNYTFTVSSQRNLIANFQLQSYTISTSSNPPTGGNAIGGGTFYYGNNCTLTANANSGYAFINWTKNGNQVSTNSTYSFTVTETALYVANFQLQNYYIDVVADPEEGGNVSGGGNYIYGETCTIRANANTGYNFINWTENGALVSTETEYTFFVDSNRNLKANFSICSFAIAATTEPENGGIITGTGGYNFGETCTLSIEPFTNYTFLHWSEDGEVVSEEPTFSFTVKNSHSFVAHLLFFDGINENIVPFELYPNPVDDILYIEGKQMQKYLIFNILGDVLESKEIGDQTQLSLNLKHYEPNTYIIVLYTKDGIVTKQFVKQ